MNGPQELIRDVRTVAIHLMAGEEAAATADVLAEKYPDATIARQSACISIERLESLVIDLPSIAERLGYEYDVPTFLVILSSYTGRINVDDDRVTLETEVKRASA